MAVVDKLIEILCRERGERPIVCPQSQKDSYWRALVNVRPPAPLSEEYIALEGQYLGGKLAERGVVNAEKLHYSGNIALWKWWSRHIWYNRYDCPVGEVFGLLLNMVKDKQYFVITTNVDHLFQRADFDKSRLFYTQGDYGLLQCSRPCRKLTYDNKEQIERMVREQRDMKVPDELIPRCPVCGRPMTVNLRADDTFVEDSGWYAAAQRYENFVRGCKGKNTVLLELGVGGNTPVIIKYPFWAMSRDEGAAYICINKGEAFAPDIIGDRSVCLDGDITQMIKEMSA